MLLGRDTFSSSYYGLGFNLSDSTWELIIFVLSLNSLHCSFKFISRSRDWPLAFTLTIHPLEQVEVPNEQVTKYPVTLVFVERIRMIKAQNLALFSNLSSGSARISKSPLLLSLFLFFKSKYSSTYYAETTSRETALFNKTKINRACISGVLHFGWRTLRHATYVEAAASRRVASRRPVTHRGRRSIDRVGREGLQGSRKRTRETRPGVGQTHRQRCLPLRGARSNGGVDILADEIKDSPALSQIRN